MFAKRLWGLQSKLALPMLALWCALYGLLELYWLPDLLADEQEKFVSQQKSNLHFLSLGLSEAIYKEDFANIYTSLEQGKSEHPEWLEIVLYDQLHQQIYPLEPYKSSPNINSIAIEHMITEGRVSPGSLLLIADTEQHIAQTKRHIAKMRWLFIMLLLAAIFSTYILQRRLVIAPLMHLSKAVENIGEQNLTTELQTTGRDEIGVLTTAFRDMQEKISKREQDLLLMTEKALASSHAKSDFLAKMNHELRTPLNAILGSAQLIQFDFDENTDPETQEYIQVILNSGEHLLGLIDNVMNYTRIESGKFQVNIETIELKPFLEETIASIKLITDKSGNKFEAQFDNLEGQFHTDPSKLRQIIYNLINNANKFTHEGKISLVANSIEFEGAKHLRICVTDTGIGVPADQIDKIFELFHQVDNSYTRKYEGTGLGLALCREFCHGLGGKIEVDSKPNTGSTFCVTLPFQPPANNA